MPFLEDYSIAPHLLASLVGTARSIIANDYNPLTGFGHLKFLSNLGFSARIGVETIQFISKITLPLLKIN